VQHESETVGKKGSILSIPFLALLPLNIILPTWTVNNFIVDSTAQVICGNQQHIKQIKLQFKN
jgi:hypothetical protein